MNRRANWLGLFLLLLWHSPASTMAGAPNVTSLFPAGGAQGQVVEVTATGSFDPWPVRGWVDEAGLTIEPAPEKGKLLFRVSADARPGVRLVRLYNADGASDVRPFVVGLLPEIVELEPNDDPKHAQAVPSLPAVVNGRLRKKGDLDAFAVTLTKGQTLIAALDANRRLGAPMDAVIQVATPDGFLLEQVDDAPGLDPKVAFLAPADGTYHIRVFAFPLVQDSTIAFAGGDAFVYRLTLSTGPFLERTMPLAVGRDGLGVLTAIGTQIPSEASRLKAEPTSRSDRVRVWHPALANDLNLARLSYASLVEAAAVSPGEPQTLPIPAAVSGRISSAREEDVYQIQAQAGQTLRLRVEAQGLGSPLDPVLQLIDASGKVVAEQDDIRVEVWDIDLTAKVPAAGSYRIKVSDANGQGGDDFVYLLHVTDGPAEAAPNVTADRFTVQAGKSVEMVINLREQQQRGRGRGRQATTDATDQPELPIALEILGLPAGVTSEVKEEKGATRTLTLKASADAPAFSGPILVTARIDGREQAVWAAVDGPGRGIETLWLTVVRP
jgi:Bacterial pre-peptidase C-terminal domain